MNIHDMLERTGKFKSREELYNLAIRVYEKLVLEKEIRK